MIAGAIAGPFLSGDIAALAQDGASVRRPRITDTVEANIYADNSFMLYINGKLVAVDSIAFMPHNVVSVDILPVYPMTIAVMAQDNADPKTGMEYANTSIGDGGFILKLGDGTVTDQRWKVKKFSWGLIGRDIQNPTTKHLPLPAGWYKPEFDDGTWDQATVYSESQVSPKGPFYEHDFKGAQFIWSGDLELDNTVLMRLTVTGPPDGRAQPDFSNLTNQIPGRGRGRGRRRGGRR